MQLDSNEMHVDSGTGCEKNKLQPAEKNIKYTHLKHIQPL